jgi:hypothetical protein
VQTSLAPFESRSAVMLISLQTEDGNAHLETHFLFV